MQFLIQAEWVQQEAADRDVKVTDAEVKKSFDDQKKQAFPKEADYKKFLKDSGMSEEDILFRVKLDTLQTKLTQQVTKDKVKISDEDITEYYEKNKKRFAQPERRDLNVVLTKTEAKADEAKKKLEDGESFKAVAKEYSIDEASKAQGGKLPDVSKGQQEKALDTAVFKAETGKVSGPVKTQFGYYVFEVDKVKKASQQSLEQAKETIRNLLRSQREQKALDAFVKDFREKYKEETKCADDFRVAECDNAPKEEQDTGPASGGAPGGAQPGAPQGTPAPQGAAPQGAPRSAGCRGSAGCGSRRALRRARADSAAADPRSSIDALERLDEITRRLRKECPWDREQDERSIVPHTVEEAYELADAAHTGDDAKLLDELGDVLFQVMFLSLLMEERGAGDLAPGGRRLPREADPPPPARVRRARGRHRRRRRPQLGRDQARGRARRRDLRRDRGHPALHALREEGAQARPGGRRGATPTAATAPASACCRRSATPSTPAPTPSSSSGAPPTATAKR